MLAFFTLCIFLKFPIILHLTPSLLSPPNFLNTIPALLCSAAFLSSPSSFLFWKDRTQGVGYDIHEQPNCFQRGNLLRQPRVGSKKSLPNCIIFAKSDILHAEKFSMFPSCSAITKGSCSAGVLTHIFLAAVQIWLLKGKKREEKKTPSASSHPSQPLFSCCGIFLHYAAASDCKPL